MALVGVRERLVSDGDVTDAVRRFHVAHGGGRGASQSLHVERRIARVQANPERNRPAHSRAGPGSELAQEAAVVGPDELLDEATLVVEAEDVDQIPDDAGAVGLERADR